jgi:predicted AlkP superfamily phosphohydrolase/phosphomutase
MATARVAVLVGLATLVGGCSRDHVAPAKKVVVIGLDGGTWDLLDGYIARGLLPNLAKLRQGGVWAPLKSIKPSSSPVIWTSIATGKSPDKHGITFFVRFPAGDTGHPAPVTSTMRRGKALWNILSKLKRDVAVVGWFVTWPVEAVNGRMISDRAHWGATDEKGVFPPAYLAGFPPADIQGAIDALPRFMHAETDFSKLKPDSTDPEERLRYLVFDRFVKAYMRDAYYLKVADRVLSDGALPDFFALYLRGTDDVQHGFWKFMQPELFDGVTPEQAADYGKVIERYWQWTDEAVGHVLSYYKDTPALVIVVSDHGAGPAIGAYKVVTPEYLYLSGSHRQTGIFIANGPGVRRGGSISDASVYDITPTILHYLGQPVGNDMDGRVLTGAFVDAIADRPVAHIETYDEAADAPTGPVASPVDDKALEHLRSLGYIE